MYLSINNPKIEVVSHWLYMCYLFKFEVVEHLETATGIIMIGKISEFSRLSPKSPSFSFGYIESFWLQPQDGSNIHLSWVKLWIWVFSFCGRYYFYVPFWNVGVLWIRVLLSHDLKQVSKVVLHSKRELLLECFPGLGHWFVICFQANLVSKQCFYTHHQPNGYRASKQRWRLKDSFSF